MTHVENFNRVMQAFLNDLSDVFPENVKIRRAADSFEYLVLTNYKKTHRIFTELFGPLFERISVRDETIFQNMEFWGIQFETLWNDPAITNTTRHSIWEYIERLVQLAHQC
jgi:hypothetical protein